ncbi:MAG: hypothetical protein LUE22_05580 [Oscillospiraceae bacterium]|nr:hypothetical protein [Oscillospiraceae bacterium]
MRGGAVLAVLGQLRPGQLETVDVEYLESLGTDSLPALSRLEGEAEDDHTRTRANLAVSRLTAQAQGERIWTQWKLSVHKAQ